MRVFNFITRQKRQKWNLKKKQWRVREATSHLQSFYAMNRKAETQKGKMGDSQTSQHHLLCFGILCKLLIRELVCLCMLIENIEM